VNLVGKKGIYSQQLLFLLKEVGRKSEFWAGKNDLYENGLSLSVGKMWRTPGSFFLGGGWFGCGGLIFLENNFLLNSQLLTIS